MKKISTIFLLLLFTSFSFAQNENNVSLVLVGKGITKEDSKQNALKNSIEQVYSSFISSKKDILSNKENENEFISLSSGNIVKEEVLSEIELPNTGFITILKVTISINKLVAFSESKGVVKEFNGGAFSQKIKLQKLNEDAEETVIKSLCETSFELLKKSVDFQLKNSTPILIGEITDQFDNSLSDYKFTPEYGYYLKEFKPEDFYVKFKVDTKHNENYFIFLNYFKKTIESIAMSKDEIDEYKSINKRIYVIKIDDAFYYLRKKENLENLYNLIIKSNIIPLSFQISSNINETIPLLKYRFSSKNNFPLYLYNDYNGNDYKYEFHSFINACSVNYDSYYFKTHYNDWFKEQSANVFKSSNIYLTYKDFLKKVYIENNETINDSNINSENKNNEPNDYLLINTKDVKENSYFFCEPFTLNEIEKIDAFKVVPIDIITTLKNEEERLKKMWFVKLDGGGYDVSYEDINGKKYNNYGGLFGNGTIANLVAVEKDRVLVKVYKTKCSTDEYCDNKNAPGKLYYVPMSKILKHIRGIEYLNKEGELIIPFN